MKLTVEEMILMKSFDHSTRGTAVASIVAEVTSMTDPELKQMSLDLKEKIAAMPEAEFATIDFTVYDEELVNEV